MSEVEPARESNAAPSAKPGRAFLREMATEAMRYWEPRRLLYNAVLAIVVLWHFAAAWPASKQSLTLDSVLFLFLLAVLANGCYCAAYLPDLFVQFTAFRPLWLRWRGLLLGVGIVFAAILTHFFCVAFFAITAPPPLASSSLRMELPMGTVIGQRITFADATCRS